MAITQYFSGTARGFNAHMRVTISFTRCMHGSVFFTWIMFGDMLFEAWLLLRLIIIQAITDMQRPVTRNSKI